jgi:hypothetical protein
MTARRACAALLAGSAVALWFTAPSAAAGEACSCSERDPTTAVELAITSSAPVEHSRIGPEQETVVVDLRGEETTVVGDLPELLAGVDLATVPVLMAVGDGTDECAGSQPAAGVDLSLTGHTYVDDGATVVWTGPCQGELTVVEGEMAGAAEAEEDDDLQPALGISAVILIVLAAVCLALALLGGPILDEDEDEDVDADADPDDVTVG